MRTLYEEDMLKQLCAKGLYQTSSLKPKAELPLDRGGQIKKKKKIYIYIYICILILAILFYKITFYFPLIISLLLLRVMLYSQTFL